MALEDETNGTVLSTMVCHVSSVTLDVGMISFSMITLAVLFDTL